jgi:hypothetical protein
VQVKAGTHHRRPGFESNRGQRKYLLFIFAFGVIFYHRHRVLCTVVFCTNALHISSKIIYYFLLISPNVWIKVKAITTISFFMSPKILIRFNLNYCTYMYIFTNLILHFFSQTRKPTNPFFSVSHNILTESILKFHLFKTEFNFTLLRVKNMILHCPFQAQQASHYPFCVLRPDQELV